MRLRYIWNGILIVELRCSLCFHCGNTYIIEYQIFRIESIYTQRIDLQIYYLCPILFCGVNILFQTFYYKNNFYWNHRGCFRWLRDIFKYIKLVLNLQDMFAVKLVVSIFVAKTTCFRLHHSIYFQWIAIFMVIMFLQFNCHRKNKH